MNEHYDIFISYRRDGGFETAKHLNDLLVHDGYTVSFDIGTLREGDFDETLLKRIDQCVDFILVVDKHTFDRTLDPEFDPKKDWLRTELAYALKLRKNIIPIFLDGINFPECLPDDVKEIQHKNGLCHNSEYFDAFYGKIKGFLHSQPRNIIKDKYDIFISYRRTRGAQYARILQLKLIERGYKVFLDYDEINEGVFDSGVREAIKSAPIFMLVLSPGILERCVNVNDWVRQEILLAIKENKHFIPIDPDNKFDGQFPEGIPEEIKSLFGSHQQSGINFGQYLDASLDMMIRNRVIPVLGMPAKKESLLQSIINLIANIGHKHKENLIDSYIPQKVNYDVFISYRRVDGRDVARNIQQALKAREYKNIFFDYDSIQKGEFTKRIVDAIYSCSDFILVLSPKSMQRCTNDGDPVANEIRTALKYKKNIIPVTIDGKEVKWPRAFPDDLKFIKGLQFHDHKSDSYFEHSIDELCEKLTCKKS